MSEHSSAPRTWGQLPVRLVLALALALVLALVLAACGEGGGGSGTADDPAAFAGLLERLPADTQYVAMVDVGAMAQALGVDREELRTPDEPMTDAEDGLDPAARALGVLRSTAVPALLSPFTQTFGFLDLGAIDAAVYAFETDEGRWGAVSATTQPLEELEQGLEDDGFLAQGDGRWVFPEEDEAGSDDPDELLPPNSPTGGFPAVAVEEGLFIMASSTAALDAMQDADGAGTGLRSLVEGAGASWGVAAYAFEPTIDPEVCQEGAMALAIGADGEQVHALVLGGGDDVFASGHPLDVDQPTVSGETTRYEVSSPGDGPAEQVVFNTLLDSPPFASC